MRICLLFILISVFAGCTKHDKVIVDIEDPRYREKYIEVLDETGLKYSIMESGKIAVDVEDADVLRSRMEKYYEYRAMRTRELNQKLKQKEMESGHPD